MTLDRHTRMVGWLKVLLPLLALAMLSTLFLVSRSIDPSQAIPYADVDVEDRARTPRMTDATYAGTTRDGGTVTLTAAEAVPGATEGEGSARRVAARIESPDGAATDLVAAAVDLTTTPENLRLSGGVTASTSSGYRMETPALTLGLQQSTARADGPVSAEGPPGTITAAGMEIAEDPANPGRYLLVFKGGVRLLYQP